MIEWISVQDRMPEDSEEVFITDGVNISTAISTAHWFARRFNPRIQEHLPGAWVNQWSRLTGRYIEEPTHWMPVKELLKLLRD